MDKNFRIKQIWNIAKHRPTILIKDRAGLLRAYPYLAAMLDDINDDDNFRISWTINEYSVEIEMIAED